MTIPWPPPIEYWRPLVESVAARYEMDPALIAAVIWQESNGDQNKTRYEEWLGLSSIGLMQIIPFNWRGVTETQLLSPRFNVDYGAAILTDAIRQADGDIRLGLAAYNCSFEGVAADKCGRWGGYHYADSVLQFCREFGGCAPKPAERRR